MRFPALARGQPPGSVKGVKALGLGSPLLSAPSISRVPEGPTGPAQLPPDSGQRGSKSSGLPREDPPPPFLSHSDGEAHLRPDGNAGPGSWAARPAPPRGLPGRRRSAGCPPGAGCPQGAGLCAPRPRRGRTSSNSRRARCREAKKSRGQRAGSVAGQPRRKQTPSKHPAPGSH